MPTNAPLPIEIYIWPEGTERPGSSDCFDIVEVPHAGLAPMKDDVLYLMDRLQKKTVTFKVIERVVFWYAMPELDSQKAQPFQKMWIYVRPHDV